mmetsp:Transcript_9122/g.10416  ORF Transcript_9122/g.10416 Transcript_9122/m.10416 type:complete len:258 (+) Transcript_9122:54-827(+)
MGTTTPTPTPTPLTECATTIADADDDADENDDAAEPLVLHVIFIRHGRTIDNEQGVISGGEADPDLTPEGREQAQQSHTVYQALRATGIVTDRTPVYTTDRKRALDTATFFTGRDRDRDRDGKTSSSTSSNNSSDTNTNTNTGANKNHYTDDTKAIILSLWKMYPDAGLIKDTTTNLYPFQSLAAAKSSLLSTPSCNNNNNDINRSVPGGSTKAKNIYVRRSSPPTSIQDDDENQSNEQLSIIYQFLREAPEVLRLR